MGRRPDPAAVKAAKAPVRSKRGRSPSQPELALDQVPEARLRVPAGIKGRAAEIWQKIAPKLRDVRLMAETDEHVIARYCRNYAKWEQLRDGLDRRGYTYDAVSTSGARLRRLDPAFLAADRLERQLLAIEDRFGMNPAERQRIMAGRAAPARGELPFGGQPGQDDLAAPPAPAAEPEDSPIGFLTTH